VAAREDALIAISSSGQSANIRNAAAEMRRLGGKVVTLSGFKGDNPLRALGDFNIWLDSTDYGMVEIGHQFVLHNLADRIRLGMQGVG
jgi:D-sedoheptulose 7-phosphate isomerase